MYLMEKFEANNQKLSRFFVSFPPGKARDQAIAREFMMVKERGDTKAVEDAQNEVDDRKFADFKLWVDELTGIAVGPSFLLATVSSTEKVEPLIATIKGLRYDLDGASVDLVAYKFGSPADYLKPVVWTVHLPVLGFVPKLAQSFRRFWSQQAGVKTLPEFEVYRLLLEGLNTGKLDPTASITPFPAG